MYLDYYIMGIILLPGLILAIIAQVKVNSAYSKYSKVIAKGNQTAFEVARLLLDTAGLKHIKINKVSGHLTDHYNPKTQSINLSSGIYNSKSIAAIGIAAHEVGHAIQYKQNYMPVKIRSLLIPVTNFASSLLWPLVIVGLLFNFMADTTTVIGLVFIWSGIILFGLSILVNLVTLPTEFNASNRAIKVLSNSQILDSTETVGAKKVLSAAALTYVAALLVSMLNLLRFVLVVSRR